MFEGFFFVFSAFKENVIEGDGPKNKMATATGHSLHRTL
jgi:hypothetical protein